MTEIDLQPLTSPSPFGPKDRAALSRNLLENGWAKLTDFDRARWHCYIRAWRRHCEMKNESPVDPQKVWANVEYDDECERVWKAEMDPKRLRGNQMMVREGFRDCGRAHGRWRSSM
jgi:hypothetical protein